MNATIIAGIILTSFLLLAALSIYFTTTTKGRSGFILAIYLLIFFYTIGQSLYYHHYLKGTSPDESAHISYVAYLHESGDIIPVYEDMKLLTPEPLKWSIDLYEYRQPTVNYICHPPLYYYILNGVNAIHSTEEETVLQINKDRLRYTSLAIFALGILLLLYIGYSRIPKDKPWLHLFYAIACTCIPMLTFEGCAVTNDNLALLTAAINILGLIRFCEKKRDITTYILIALGISASLMTKMTTALLCVMMSLVILFVTMLTEKSIKSSLNKYFYMSIPVYLIALAYLAIIYSRYGSIQPSLQMVCSRKYFESTIYYINPSERTVYNFSEYIVFFVNQFLLSWTGIVGASVNFLKLSVFTKTGLVLEALWLTPILLIILRFNKIKSSYMLPIFSAWGSCLLTMLIQFKSAWGTFLERGYLGGSQARYYLPFIFALALAFAVFFEKLFDFFTSREIDASNQVTNSDNKNKTSGKLSLPKVLIITVVLGYCFLLLYSSFPYFLLHFSKDLIAADLAL